MKNEKDMLHDIEHKDAETMAKLQIWREFRAAGLLWWINRFLHIFGWAIVIVTDEKRHVISAYPQRCRYRGFGPIDEEEGFYRLAKYLARNAKELESEISNGELPF